MSIPDFDQWGNLPPGVYFCTWDEFIDRFQTNLHRARLIQGLIKAMIILKTAGCRTIYINGSFVTQKPKPNDFDACWETDGVDFNYILNNAPELLDFYDKRMKQKIKYKGELFPIDMLADGGDLNFFELFQIDQIQNRKGIIAIDLMRWDYDHCQ